MSDDGDVNSTGDAPQLLPTDMLEPRRASQSNGIARPLDPSSPVDVARAVRHAAAHSAAVRRMVRRTSPSIGELVTSEQARRCADALTGAAPFAPSPKSADRVATEPLTRDDARGGAH